MANGTVSLWRNLRADGGFEVPPGDPGWRLRLDQIDYPSELASPSGSNWRPQVLTIAVIASETDFERALEQATPIVESIEFHPGR